MVACGSPRGVSEFVDQTMDTWTIVGTYASIAGFFLGLYVLYVAKGARQAAQEARVLARKRNLAEELEQATKYVEQVGDYLNKKEWLAVRIRAQEIMTRCRESLTRWHIITATDQGKIRWHPTATDDEFTASLKGKYELEVTRTRAGYFLRMLNDAEQEMLLINNEDDGRERIAGIFNLARRTALNVDTAIDDIIGGDD